MRVLWIENHAVFVRMAGRQFLAAHELTVVPSVAAARSALKASAFDAVLVDYDLDDGKGSEVVGLVRSLSGRPVVIAVSSHGDGNAALMKAGADATCSKMEFSKIERVIEAAICNKGRPNE